MAADKLVDSAQLDSGLTSIADSIRSKFGTNGPLTFPTGFVSAINNVASRSSSDLTASGGTVTAPAGYYASSVNKSVTSGTAGTPTATKGTVSNHSVSVTPSVTNTTGYITGGTKTGTAVSVSASELVSGTKTITSAGTTNITNYASVSVAKGSATIPATSISADPTISVNPTTGLITASVSKAELVSPNITDGYVLASSATPSGISVSGSSTSQLTTQAGTTITPTESLQTAVSANKYTLGDVKIAAISSSYIGSAVERKSESDTYRIGSNLVVPAGYYPENVVVAIPTDTYISSSLWYLDANNILVM